MSSLYLDASAIAKLVIAESESSALGDYVRGRGLVSSRIAIVEVTKAVARANPKADPQRMFARIAFVELDRDLASIASKTGDPSLRALDAIHLASALRLGREIESFLTYDSRQAEAARTSGLAVASPA